MADLKEQLAVENYKFILLKIQHLDEALTKNIALYSKLLTSILALMIAAILFEKSDKITAEMLQMTFNFSKVFIVFLSVTFMLLTVANIFSWRDYRHEEMALLEKLDVDIGRKKPSFKNFLRWVETWFLFALLVISMVALNLETFLKSLM